MAKLASHISSETDLKAHIASYPELYEDLAVDALEDRLEMWCICDQFSCLCDDFDLCITYIEVCQTDT